MEKEQKERQRMAKKMVTLKELEPFYYRWVRMDKDENILEISVERTSITDQLFYFLLSRGYEMKSGRKDKLTEHFFAGG